MPERRRRACVRRADFRQPYDLSPQPRRDLLDPRSFLTTSSLIATRGCHNRCGFCYLSTNDLAMPYQARDVEAVAREIAEAGQPYGVFTDNNLGSRPDYLRALCRAMRPRQVLWNAAVSVDVSDDPRLVREMALAGCNGVFLGLESLTDANLADARKKTPLARDYARRVRLFHDNGIQVNGSFVLGFDHDRPDCFERTCSWIEDNRLECATFHILTPYPGTPLFRQMQQQGRLLHTNWSLYDTAHVVFRPNHMTADELAAGYAWCYRRLFSHASIWRRRPASWRAVPAYIPMSYLYKRTNRLWPLLIRYPADGRRLAAPDPAGALASLAVSPLAGNPADTGRRYRGAIGRCAAYGGDASRRLRFRAASGAPTGSGAIDGVRILGLHFEVEAVQEPVQHRTPEARP